jgi:CPA2 family monovalent cation:H+ antiporter-2
MLAETSFGPKVEHLIHPVKDLFSAVFFVSVGMLINPKVLVDYFWIILLMTVITIVGKLISTAIGALISGRSFKSSVQAGMSLAQIGEFSFIIATLGMTLKVTSDFLYPIAVAVSAVTTFTTPYLIKLSDPFSEWLTGRLPAEMKASLVRYESVMATASNGNVLSLIWREYGIKIVLNTVIVVGITLAISRLALPHFGESFKGEPLGLLGCAVSLLLSSPFLWAIFFGGPVHSSAYRAETIEHLRRLQLGISIVKFLIGCALAGFVVSNFTSMLAFSGILFIALTALGVFFFTRFSEPIYSRIENRFVANLTANERAEIEKRAAVPELTPWNAMLAEFRVSPHSSLVMKTLKESGIKEKFGVTVAMIERGEKRILAPKREDVLLPCDKLFVIGTDDQLGSVSDAIETKPSGDLPSVDDSFGLASLVAIPEDKFVHKTIRECGLREAVNGLIVGLEREGQRYLSPESSMMLLPGDLIWLVGDKRMIKDLRA